MIWDEWWTGFFSTDIWGPVYEFIGTNIEKPNNGWTYSWKTHRALLYLVIGQKEHCTEIITLAHSAQRVVLTAHRNIALWAMETYRGQQPLKITCKEMNIKQIPKYRNKNYKICLNNPLHSYSTNVHLTGNWEIFTAYGRALTWHLLMDSVPFWPH